MNFRKSSFAQILVFSVNFTSIHASKKKKKRFSFHQQNSEQDREKYLGEINKPVIGEVPLCIFSFLLLSLLSFVASFFPHFLNYFISPLPFSFGPTLQEYLLYFLNMIEPLQGAKY